MTTIVPKFIGRCEVMRRRKSGEKVLFHWGFNVDQGMTWPSRHAVSEQTLKDLVARRWILEQRDPENDSFAWYCIPDRPNGYPFSCEKFLPTA